MVILILATACLIPIREWGLDYLFAKRSSLRTTVQLTSGTIEMALNFIFHYLKGNQAMNLRQEILLIEDEKNICNFIATALRAQDYKVSFANSAANGLSLATSGCPDLILLDLGLPDMDGIDVIRNVLEWSNIPIIVISARTQEYNHCRRQYCSSHTD